MSLNLPTLDEINARPHAPAKGLPHQLVKQAEKKAAVKKDDAFRAEIWKLDGGRSRATGRTLVKSGTTDWEKLGEVDHSIPRSLAPDRLWDVTNALLLSKAENRLRKVCCLHAPEHRYFDYSGPDDRRQPQTFVWRDDDGTVTKTRRG